MIQTKTVHVTKEDYLSGVNGNPFRSPIALAIGRAFRDSTIKISGGLGPINFYCHVQFWVQMMLCTYTIPLPERVMRAFNNFEEYGIEEPLTFHFHLTNFTPRKYFYHCELPLKENRL